MKRVAKRSNALLKAEMLLRQEQITYDEPAMKAAIQHALYEERVKEIENVD